MRPVSRQYNSTIQWYNFLDSTMSTVTHWIKEWFNPVAWLDMFSTDTFMKSERCSDYYFYRYLLIFMFLNQSCKLQHSCLNKMTICTFTVLGGKVNAPSFNCKVFSVRTCIVCPVCGLFTLKSIYCLTFYSCCFWDYFKAPQELSCFQDKGEKKPEQFLSCWTHDTHVSPNDCQHCRPLISSHLNVVWWARRGRCWVELGCSSKRKNLLLADPGSV